MSNIKMLNVIRSLEQKKADILSCLFLDRKHIYRTDGGNALQELAGDDREAEGAFFFLKGSFKAIYFTS